jgi:hypothetical protein
MLRVVKGADNGSKPSPSPSALNFSILLLPKLRRFILNRRF